MPKKKLKVLDLFAGLRGWSKPFMAKGHDVTTLDIDPRFGSTFTQDILKVKSLEELERNQGRFDIVLASPPCNCYSVASISKHWAGGFRAYQPKTPEAKQALQITKHTFKLIDSYNPKVYVIENPRGVMRKVTPRPPDTTTWYCTWKETRAKPTDLWHNMDDTFPWPAPCKNNNPDCHHERAPRGSKTGTQGLANAALRAVIPFALADEVRKYSERVC